MGSAIYILPAVGTGLTRLIDLERPRVASGGHVVSKQPVALSTIKVQEALGRHPVGVETTLVVSSI
jgi:hypothetical protein